MQVNKLSAAERLAAIRSKVQKDVAGATITLSTDKPKDISVISTGSLLLDRALGVGGYPYGRIVEIYGPESSGKTTLMLHAIAECQKNGGVAAFIDAEHALDLRYAGAIGVNTNELMVVQPDHGEQALACADAFIDEMQAGDIVVIDSVASLVPKAEIEGDVGDSHVGLQARLMSQTLRRIVGKAQKSGVIVMFTNQIRMKIGVMFGCFSYNTRVSLADGTSMKIGKIVNQRLPVEVLSFNPKTGAVEPKKVIDWHDNGEADFFLQFRVEGVGGSGRSSFGVTPNHMIFTQVQGKWVERPAGELKVGDILGHSAPLLFNSVQREVALGSILGDGSLRRRGHLTSIRFGHGPDQTDYCRWKAEIFDDLVAWSGTNAAGGESFDCKATYDLTKVHDLCYGPGHRRIHPDFVKGLTDRSIAIWYMDDGSFSGSYSKWGNGKVTIPVKSYSEEDVATLVERLVELGYPEPTYSRGILLWSGDRTDQFMQRVAKYIPPCMDYKVHPKYRGAYDGENYQQASTEQVSHALVPVRILDIYEKPKLRSMHRFDISVEGNHTYLVDGIAVHNSPETTSGGNSLKFYASVRLDIRRIGSVKEAGKAEKDVEVTGNRTRVKVVKNKVAPPFREAEFTIEFGKGICYTEDLLDLAVEYGLIEKSGGWFSYKNEKIGNGKTNVLAILQSEDWSERILDIDAEIRDRIKQLPL
jgi:recombination protein RecA